MNGHGLYPAEKRKVGALLLHHAWRTAVHLSRTRLPDGDPRSAYFIGGKVEVAPGRTADTTVSTKFKGNSGSGKGL